MVCPSCTKYQCSQYVYISSLQDGQNVLHRAAASGNVSLFDWLVKRFSLQPDQWSKASDASGNKIGHNIYVCDSIP